MRKKKKTRIEERRDSFYYPEVCSRSQRTKNILRKIAISDVFKVTFFRFCSLPLSSYPEP
jgi:hypothetical protein